MKTPNNYPMEYFSKNYEMFIKELVDFLKIPSISTNPENIDAIQNAAKFLKTKLLSLGCENVEIFPTQKHPIVFGEWVNAGPNAQTILIYGHYDVQPPDPLNEWKTPPFEPNLIGQNLYARGASDMKGQIFAVLYAIECLLKTIGIPINIKFIFEGEEEIGSPSLEKFLRTHKEDLTADCILNPDAGMVSQDLPTIVYSLRGMAYFELIINGPSHDLHSGLFGGIIDNPAHVMSTLISKLHDSSGKVTLDGFYDGIPELSKSEREKIAKYALPEQGYMDLTGVKKLYGNQEYTATERIGARPTLDINGLYAGFIGEGAKTIIPSFAKAKISCRLVPGQKPDQVFNSFKQFCKENLPETVTYEVFLHSGAPAYFLEEAPGMKNLTEAYKRVWDKEVVYKREGGSIPVATSMKNILGIDSLLTGFGLPDDQIHSPNEHLNLSNWKKGIEALIFFFSSFTQDRGI